MIMYVQGNVIVSDNLRRLMHRVGKKNVKRKIHFLFIEWVFTWYSGKFMYFNCLFHFSFTKKMVQKMYFLHPINANLRVNFTCRNFGRLIKTTSITEFRFCQCWLQETIYIFKKFTKSLIVWGKNRYFIWQCPSIGISLDLLFFQVLIWKVFFAITRISTK